MIWYAVMMDEYDEELNSGSYDLEEAKVILADLHSDDGYIAVIDKVKNSDPVLKKKLQISDLYDTELALVESIRDLPGETFVTFVGNEQDADLIWDNKTDEDKKSCYECYLGRIYVYHGKQVGSEPAEVIKIYN